MRIVMESTGKHTTICGRTLQHFKGWTDNETCVHVFVGAIAPADEQSEGQLITIYNACPTTFSSIGELLEEEQCGEQ
jgi:hypothetical protein